MKLQRASFLFLCCLLPTALAAQEIDVSGLIADASGKSAKGASTVQVVIESYTSAEHSELLGKELERGVASLYRAMTHIEKGFVRIGKDIGYPIGYARSEKVDGGIRVTAILDRPIPMFNVYRSIRSLDHPFGAIQLTLDQSGAGTGRLIPTASIKLGDGYLAIDYEGTTAFQIVKIKPTK